jgi:predicted glycosyltransferase
MDNDNAKYVLLGMRMVDVQDIDWHKVENLHNIIFIAVSRDVTLKNCIHMQKNDVPFEDVLNACDAVLSKPGYSIVSEILANRTPMIYIPRCDFLEDPILIDALEKFAICQELSQQDFYAGNWQSSFNRLFASQQQWTDIRLDGAEVIARKIINRIR